MLRSLEEIIGFSIIAKDGEIGKIKDFYFDSAQMAIRYAVVDTGNWLESRKVLISPESFLKPHYEEKEFAVNLTKKQIEESPEIDREKPVSRQFEESLVSYYDWPSYWSGGIGTGIYVSRPLRTVPIDTEIIHKKEQYKKELYENELYKKEHKKEDQIEITLRSVKEVDGYNIKAKDGRIGHVEEMVADDSSWLIRYIVVDTRNWLPGKKVVIAPEWVRKISWDEREVVVGLPREEIKNAPEYSPDVPVTRVFEERLYDYYEKDKYWD